MPAQSTHYSGPQRPAPPYGGPYGHGRGGDWDGADDGDFAGTVAPATTVGVAVESAVDSWAPLAAQQDAAALKVDQQAGAAPTGASSTPMDAASLGVVGVAVAVGVALLALFFCCRRKRPAVKPAELVALAAARQPQVIGHPASAAHDNSNGAGRQQRWDSASTCSGHLPSEAVAEEPIQSNTHMHALPAPSAPPMSSSSAATVVINVEVGAVCEEGAVARPQGQEGIVV